MNDDDIYIILGRNWNKNGKSPQYGLIHKHFNYKLKQSELKNLMQYIDKNITIGLYYNNFVGHIKKTSEDRKKGNVPPANDGVRSPTQASKSA